MKHGCVNCKYRFFSVTRSPCDNCAMSGDKYSEWTAQTNADRIRSMTNEELATFIEEASCPPTCYRTHIYECRKEDCAPCWLAWLQAEVKE